MNEELGILIAGKLDIQKTVRQINSDLETLAKSLDSLNIEVDLGKATQQIQEFNKNVSKMSKSAGSSSGDVGQQITKSVSIDLDKLRKNHADVFAEIDKLQKHYGGAIQSIRRQGGLDLADAEDPERLQKVNVALKDIDGTIRSFEILKEDEGLVTRFFGETTNIEKSVKETQRLLQEQQKVVDQLNKLKYDGQISSDDHDAMIQLVNKSDMDNLNTIRQSMEYMKSDQKELNALKQHQNKAQESYEKMWVRAEANRKKEIADAKQRLEYEKQMAKHKVQDIRRRYDPIITPEQNQQLDNYLNKINNLNPAHRNFSHQLRMLNADFKGVTSGIKDAGSKVEGFGKQLEIAMTRIPIWMIGMTAFYAPLRGFQRAIDHVIMLDSQMVELRRVMDAAPRTYNSLMDQSIALSSELGNRIEDVNQALVEFARQGYDPNTLLHLTETATIAANISELATTEAMSSLTASMMAFNIEAENSMTILDRINEVNNICLPA